MHTCLTCSLRRDINVFDGVAKTNSGCAKPLNYITRGVILVVKRPPPITEFYRFPISAGVALLAIFVKVIERPERPIDRLVMNVQAFEDQPYRLVASALPHADAMHLLFNVIWLWVLGTAIEERFGPIRLFGLMVLFAVGSAAAEYAIFVGGIGLSGVVYGLFGFLWVLSRADRKLVDAVDAQTSFVFILWFFVCIATTITKVWVVANVAHAVGWLLGLLAGFAIAGGAKLGRPRNDIRIVSILGILVVSAASLLVAARFRPIVNLAPNGGADIAALASRALDKKQFDQAITRYRQALRVSPKSALIWYNLGVAYSRKGEYKEAVAAFNRANELAPEEQDYKRTALESTRYLAYLSGVQGDHGEAVRLYEDALKRGKEDAPTLYNLSLEYKAVGKTVEAKDALLRAARIDPSFAAYIVPDSPRAEPDAGVEDAAPE